MADKSMAFLTFFFPNALNLGGIHENRTGGPVPGRLFSCLYSTVAVWYASFGAVAIRRLVTPLREGVERMGNGRWAKVLRFLLCFIMILAVMIYISPKAC